LDEAQLIGSVLEVPARIGEDDRPAVPGLRAVSPRGERSDARRVDDLVPI